MKKNLVLTVVWGALLASPAFAQSHRDIVEQVAAEHPPAKTIEGAFDFTLRVLDRLTALYPEEHAGLVEKVPPGESIIPYAGTWVSISRIAYPDQHSVKLLQDVPTLNGPEWVTEGPLSIGGFLRGYLRYPVASAPAPSQPPIVVNVPPPPAPIFDIASLQAQIAAMAAELHEHVRADGEAHASLEQNISDGRAENRSFFAAVGAHWKSITAFAAPFVTYYACHSTGKC